MLLLGFTEGRIALRWSKEFNNIPASGNRIFILTFALFTAYFLLYLANASFPSIPVGIIPLTCSIILVGTIPFLRLISSEKYGTHLFFSKDVPEMGSDISAKSKVTIYIIIFIIYLSAGFTYTIIFPDMRTYGNIDRYYNVLPFVLMIPIAGLIVFKAGVRHLLNIGIALLGISYILYQLPHRTATYFLVESFIQPGWAFIDLFVWIIGSYIARKNGKYQLLPFCVAIFLSGTVTGAVLSILFLRLELHHYKTIVFLSLSLLPLFFVIPLLNRIVSYRNVDSKNLKSIIPDNLLTDRENEIAHLLLKNKSQKEICGEIHISINTLKTHTRNIYRKLGVKNKQDLRRLRSL
jgi:DNA-binding CsgD family transcriptional regulator